MFHLLSVTTITSNILSTLLDRASQFKSGARSTCAKNLTGVFITDRPSLRTRASFSLGFEKLGGRFHSFVPDEIGIGTRESIADIGGVLDGYYDLLVARILDHEQLKTLAQISTLPVINGLSDTEHPAQALSDIFTMWEHFQKPLELNCVYVGDSSNVARSLALLCPLMNWNFTLIGPSKYHFLSQEKISCTPKWSAIKNADVVYTDIWTSMGQEDEQRERNTAFADYKLTTKRFSQAKTNSVFMNDMPIKRDIEVDNEVVDGPQSIIYTQAHNRLYMQMAIMEYCLTH